MDREVIRDWWKKKHTLRCLIALFLILMWYMFEFTVVKYHQNQIYSQNQLQNAQQGRHTNKGSPPIIACLSSFFSLLFSLFSLYHTVQDKHHWNLVSRRSICVGILTLPEFIIKSSCLLLAVPRDSPNCKKHSEENNSHEREYDIRKDLIFRIFLTKNVMQSFFKTELSEKMQWTCCAQRNV